MLRIGAAASVTAALGLGLLLFFAHGQGEDSRQDWPGLATLLDEQALPGATVLFNKGYCDSASDRDTACAFELSAPPTPLRRVELVPFFSEDRGVTAAVDEVTVRRLDPIVANATQVWVVYSYPSDTEHLIPARLAGLGWTETGQWDLKRIEVLRFDRAAAG